jgi:hypothetical protein
MHHILPIFRRHNAGKTQTRHEKRKRIKQNNTGETGETKQYTADCRAD